MQKDWDARLRLRVAMARWRAARMDAKRRKMAILEALAEAMPPEEYARQLVELTQSKDQRVKTRALELIGKLQGTVEDEEAGRQVVVAFSSVLTGQAVARHHGGTGHQEALPDAESPEDGGSADTDPA